MKNWLVSLKPAQLLVLGFLSYVLIGTLLLCLPPAQAQPVAWLDNLFNVVSAVSTTGLTTVSVSDSYTFWGELVLLILFQLGGIGYMTVSSALILSRGQTLSPVRLKILHAEFSLPKGFDLPLFVRQVLVFTLLIETIGTALLYFEFRAAGVENPFWSALFHCVSAFATAGFSLNNNSLEAFAGNTTVNLTIGALCYLGAIGFIVLQDAWLAATRKQHTITLTSKLILLMTAAIWLITTPLFYFAEPSIQLLPAKERFLAAAFQIMSASTTAGFNTISIGNLSSASLVLLFFAMIVGASPSGTGGGIKTTSVSALYAILASTLRGHRQVQFWKHAVPPIRLRTAAASTTLYISLMTGGLFLLCLTEKHGFLPLFFETVSAFSTVGLSMGITGDLTAGGKWILIALMFIGRVGPLTLGFSLFQRENEETGTVESDVAV
ncbi:MAG TPA: potassium transporter TrkG [Verrucomicrobiae bacterium]